MKLSKKESSKTPPSKNKNFNHQTNLIMGLGSEGSSPILEAITINQVGTSKRQLIDMDEPLQKRDRVEVAQGKQSLFEEEVHQICNGSVLTTLGV